MPAPNHTDTIIIGASAAGLACAVCLKQYGIPFILLEQHENVGSEWRNRYDRLHLHTPKKHSQLPFFKMQSNFPVYVSKNDFAKYLEEYSRMFDIQPFFNQKVILAWRDENTWEVHTATDKFTSDRVIVATGYAGKAVQPSLKGSEHFEGEIIHSSEYKNGKCYKNKKVLVVGFGNSACEIAMCLCEHNAVPSLSVRSAVNVIPRDLAGIPILNIVIAQSWLTKISPRLTDAINKPVLRFVNGNLKKYGLRTAAYGPTTQVIKQKKIPLLDIGTINLIKKGKIKVYPDIDHITTNSVKFTDGREEKFDVIICATGFRPSVAEFLEGYEKVSDNDGMPTASGRECEIPGLYFCGFYVSGSGMLREIGLEAKRIGKTLAAAHYFL